MIRPVARLSEARSMAQALDALPPEIQNAIMGSPCSIDPRPLLLAYRLYLEGNAGGFPAIGIIAMIDEQSRKFEQEQKRPKLMLN